MSEKFGFQTSPPNNLFQIDANSKTYNILAALCAEIIELLSPLRPEQSLLAVIIGIAAEPIKVIHGLTETTSSCMRL
jgi:hypothetical protein